MDRNDRHQVSDDKATDGSDGLRCGDGTDAGHMLREQMEVQLRQAKATIESIENMMAAPGAHRPEDMAYAVDELDEATEQLRTDWHRSGMPW